MITTSSRSAVWAFSFLCVIYAIPAGLIILSYFSLLTTSFTITESMPGTALLLVLLLPTNLLCVYGLNRRMTWAYLGCATQLLVWIVVFGYAAITQEMVSVFNNVLIVLLLLVTGWLLYNDFFLSNHDRTPE